MRSIRLKNILFFIAILFTHTLFAEDLIINGETKYKTGKNYYDNVIIINGGILIMGEYDGSQEELGTLLLYCDSLLY